MPVSGVPEYIFCIGWGVIFLLDLSFLNHGQEYL